MKPLNIMSSPWAIIPEKYLEISRIYLSQLSKESIKFESASAQGDELFKIIDDTAIIEIESVISKKLSWLSLFFGGTSTLVIAEKIKAAINDPQVKRIILLIDSPGGSVDGTAELSELIFSLRGDKPIIAFTDGSMCSAAYWIGSAADRRIISGDTTQVGSIGVIATHVDYSHAYKDAGIDITEIVSGKFKNVGSPNAPLSSEHEEVIQAEIDHIHTAFVNNVARNLGVSVAQVRDVMTVETKPPVFIGKQAIDAGLVDAVSSFDDLMESFNDEDNTKIFMTGHVLNKLNTKSTNEEETTMNATELKEKHPDTYAAILKEGETSGIQKGMESAQVGIDTKVADARNEALKEGATNEINRIKEVQAQSLPGHEALIQECIDDGVTTGAQAAVKVLAAQKVLMEAKVKAFDEDGKEIDVPAANALDTKGEKAFMAIVKEHKESEKCSQGAAIKACVKSHPEAYAKYKEGLKSKK